ncbi:MAG: Holliday junction branch migration protein RuvA [Eggerthellaceae bacterium]|jgi:Holliday junction DNA helicase RuvA|nr:Holliday junction branch migration protein RuvA [Eggerthellaceae bacterium]CCY05131.1 holliday junction ATP-dependent DNA helicase RuvA [Eggerthella sp. CAG:1427]
MISFLSGTLVATTLDSAIVDVHGVGYQVLMSSKSLSRLGMVGEKVRVLTHLQLRDDALVLYGFLNQEEKDLFLRLTSVSSVGPKVALAVLSTFDPSDAVAAIVSQDLAAIQRVPGVGKKMASRIVLELKESFVESNQAELAGLSKRALDTKKSVTEALLSMGFTSEEAGLALKGAPEEASETLLLQYALKRLGE